MDQGFNPEARKAPAANCILIDYQFKVGVKYFKKYFIFHVSVVCGDLPASLLTELTIELQQVDCAKSIAGLEMIYLLNNEILSIESEAVDLILIMQVSILSL